MKPPAHALAAALLGAVLASACASRNKTSHFDRWAVQDKQRREQAAKEKAEAERAEKSAKAAASKPAQAAATPPPAASPAAPPPVSGGYSSLPEGETPPVKTSTKSRAITPGAQPKKDDDEAIY